MIALTFFDAPLPSLSLEPLGLEGWALPDDVTAEFVDDEVMGSDVDVEESFLVVELSSPGGGS